MLGEALDYETIRISEGLHRFIRTSAQDAVAMQLLKILFEQGWVAFAKNGVALNIAVCRFFLLSPSPNGGMLFLSKSN